LRYLKIDYTPSVAESTCVLTFNNNGQRLLEEDRRHRGVNSMKDIFQYLQPTDLDSCEQQ